MSCGASSVSPANLTEADKLQRAAIERIQFDKLSKIVKSLRRIEVPTIAKDALSDLSITLGRPLDVDGSLSSLSDTASTFFLPCDWPHDVLEYKTWSQRSFWRNMEHVILDSAINLQIPDIRSRWFEECLLRLSDLVPDLWNSWCNLDCIWEELRLHLPLRLFYRPRHTAIYHESYSRWVMLTHEELDMPHASCFVLDSGTPDENAILLSEAEAAAALVKHQLRNGIYTSHHTKPVLLATVMRNQTGRITQAHFDGKQNKLVLRQSRTMDLSGEKPSSDAWTMLRWIASQPVGQTRYEIGDTEEGACGNNNPAHDVSFTPKYLQNQDPRQREALVPEVGTGSGYPSRC